MVEPGIAEHRKSEPNAVGGDLVAAPERTSAMPGPAQRAPIADDRLAGSFVTA
jgi:hypothetical protein